MYIQHHNVPFIKATIYPNANPDTSPRFLATSPHFAVLPDGDVTYNAKPVTLSEEAQRCGEHLLALAEAEKIAGKVPDRDAVEALVVRLQGWIDREDWGHQ